MVNGIFVAENVHGAEEDDKLFLVLEVGVEISGNSSHFREKFYNDLQKVEKLSNSGLILSLFL